MTDNKTLVSLAEQINTEHGLFVEAARKSLEHALNCGVLLLQAKKSLKHGEYTAWIQDNCNFSERTARLYTYLATNRDRLAAYVESTYLAGDEDKTATIADMGIDGALTISGAVEMIKQERMARLSAEVAAEREEKREEERERARKNIGSWDDYTPEVGKILWDIRNMTDEVSKYLDAAEFGKFAPEARAFTARKVRALIAKLDEFAGELEQDEPRDGNGNL
jgi:hypothetical protein